MGCLACVHAGKNGTDWEASLKVANTTGVEKVLYAISNVKMVEGPGISGTTATNDSVPQPIESVKQSERESDAENLDAVQHGYTEEKNSYSREMATMADLKEENRHLKERVEFWKEQAHPSKGARANRQDVQEVSKQLKNAYGSKTSTAAQAARRKHFTEMEPGYEPWLLNIYLTQSV